MHGSENLKMQEAYFLYVLDKKKYKEMKLENKKECKYQKNK